MPAKCTVGKPLRGDRGEKLEFEPVVGVPYDGIWWKTPSMLKSTGKREVHLIDAVEWLPLEGYHLNLRQAEDPPEPANADDPVTAAGCVAPQNEITVGDDTPAVVIFEIRRQ